MAVLTEDIYNDVRQHGPGSFGEEELVAAVTDVIFRLAVLSYSDAAEGVTPVPAAGLQPWGLAALGVSATAGVTKIKGFTKGKFYVTLANAIADAEDAQGQLFYVDVSTASDNPADLLAEGSAGTGDYALGRCTEWIDSTHVILDIGDRGLTAVHA